MVWLETEMYSLPTLEARSLQGQAASEIVELFLFFLYCVPWAQASLWNLGLERVRFSLVVTHRLSCLWPVESYLLLTRDRTAHPI